MNYGLVSPSVDFGKVRDGRTSTLFYYDVDLSTARDNATALILPLTGNVFYVDASPVIGNATIYFQDTGISSQGAPVYVSPGFIAKVPYTKMLIENIAQPGKILRFFYGVDVDFASGNNIAISGDVNIIDNGKSRTKSGVAFLCAPNIAALVANNAHTQLWNPAGSGVNLVIEAFSVASATAGKINSGFNLAIFTTNALNTGIQSKYGGGVASKSFRAVQSNVGPLFTPNFSSLVQANQQFVVNLREPIVVPPGYGYCIAHELVNTDLLTQFEFFEDPI